MKVWWKFGGDVVLVESSESTESIRSRARGLVWICVLWYGSEIAGGADGISG